jgi:hypothetical protein
VLSTWPLGPFRSRSRTKHISYPRRLFATCQNPTVRQHFAKQKVKLSSYLFSAIESSAYFGPQLFSQGSSDTRGLYRFTFGRYLQFSRFLPQGGAECNSGERAIRVQRAPKEPQPNRFCLCSGCVNSRWLQTNYEGYGTLSGSSRHSCLEILSSFENVYWPR